MSSDYTIPPPTWDEMSLFEQLSVMPKEKSEAIILRMIERGIDPYSHPIMLRPEQLAIVNDYSSWISLFSAGRGAGKRLALDTMIPTIDGWKKNGEIEVGDTIFDEQGRLCSVVGVYDGMPERAYKITFSDGAEIVADGEHQWVTLTASERKRLNRRGEDIPADWAAKPPIVTDDILATLRYGKRGDLNHCIPTTLPLDCPEADLPMDPWVFGVWLGDGSSSTAEFTCHDNDAPHFIAEMGRREVVAEFARRRHDDKPTATYKFGQASLQRDSLGRMTPNGSAHSILKSMGVWKNKHIPSAYLRASADQRLDLLRGLIDTDGHISKTGLVEFCSTSRALADGVYELAASLGQKPVLAIGNATLKGVFVSKKYRVTWRPTIVVATLPRKVDAHRPLSAQKMRSYHRMIVSVEQVDPVPMRCLSVDSPNHMYLASEAMIPTHNTRTGAGWVNDRAEKHPNCKIILLGRTVADVRDVMINGDSGIMATASANFKPVYTPSRRVLEWPNGATALTFSSDQPSQLRGPQGHFAWADELAAYSVIPDSSGATAWDNCMMATRLGEQPQILVTTTPKRTGVMRELNRMALEDPKVTMHQTSTLSNRTNLSPEYIKAIFSKYAGTHLEQQELFGVLVGDAPGALWKSDDIVLGAPHEDVPLLTIIGVDPAVESGGDNTGIVLAQGTREMEVAKRRAWVLDDLTMDGPPDAWARAVHDLWLKNPQSIVVVEGNQGGQLLRMVLHQRDARMPVAIVKAIKSKSARAEPAVMAYRQSRVQHVRNFPLLEEEMTGWEPGVSRWSPGSVDALVWALTVLLVDESPLWPYLPAVAMGPAQSHIPSLENSHGTRRRASGLTVPPWRRR